MVKVIETNISLDENDNIADFQSRVIEVDSWESIINEISNAKTVTRNAAIGNMYGTTIPRSSRVVNIVLDDNKLSCDIYNYCDIKTKKLVYLIQEN